MTTTEASDTRRVLELLSQGKVTVEEAEQLLGAMSGAASEPTRAATSARWMRITIHRSARDGRPEKTVNIRVPLGLARSGLKFGAMFPTLFGPKLQEEFRKQGVDVDFSKIDLSSLDSLLDNMGETTIDDGKSQIRIRVE